MSDRRPARPLAFIQFQCRPRVAVPWQNRELPCRHEPELFDAADDDRVNRAKAICYTCPVRTDCLEHALTHGEWLGVWGAMSEDDRRELARQRGITPPRRTAGR